MTLNTLLIITVASIGISWLIHKMSGKFPPLAALLLLDVAFSVVVFGMPTTAGGTRITDEQVAIWLAAVAYGAFLAQYVRQLPKGATQVLGLLGLLALAYWCGQTLIGGMSLGAVYASLPLALLLGLLYRVGGMLRTKLQRQYRMLKGGVVDTTHYRSKTITIVYHPGSEVVQLDLLPDTIEDEDGNALPVQRQRLALPLLAMRKRSRAETMPLLVANVSAWFSEKTQTALHTSSSTHHVPGSIATGYSGADTVTVHIPASTVTTTQLIGGTYERGTGFGTLWVTITSDGQTRRLSFATNISTGNAVAETCKAIAAHVQAPLDAQEAQLAAAAEQQRLQKEQQRRDDDATQVQQVHAAKERTAAAAQEIVRAAGLSTLPEEVFIHYAGNKQGGVSELIAADRQGRGVLVYEDGASTWQGYWAGAQVSCDEFCLHIKLVDAVYRQQHLKERRASLLRKDGKLVRQEWADRISILSGPAPA